MHAALLNGLPATAEDLRVLALVNYGHYSSMQVRNGAVQGIALHEQRLQAGTLELFGSNLDFSAVREQMRAAVASTPDCSLRATVFSHSFDFRSPGGSFVPEVLISLSPPAQSSAPALKVKSFGFQRPLPHVKHVGTFPLFHYRRLALGQGYDDALFVDADGRISEGSVWNVGFWDGEQLVWPEAPALRGTSEQLLQAGLRESGIGQVVRPVRLAELGGFQAAFASNASGVQQIASIDETEFGVDSGLAARLQKALESQAWQRL
ncbi:aminotransferase class IV family protein [Pseudoxanthomonas sacheonensis]|uniref:Branched-subunit amino acid aminotransferase/4-amino-4-deoxychorismate lyase n=1 Tax=Pseudoxanthomonas sacheonensis TaxID=443615 RepID=A0ABU1RNV2_9GAMM|nr:aminotransferase class IV family protein [Pseudoxanthomonas sacheonensis]MDR6840282.1 branched-subunit amino acid aminotransferase/4-amino-4-deoxychorismate lyase [Pseudoxanthomonas sacheonensis]